MITSCLECKYLDKTVALGKWSECRYQPIVPEGTLVQVPLVNRKYPKINCPVFREKSNEN